MKEFVKGLVSIVTPVYNGENYIHLLLDSVLRQTYPRIQMILVDDGSTDNTLEIIEKYKSQFANRGYAFEIIRGKHSCASGAMCLGLPEVKGEYLIWPDGDDELYPDSVEKRVSFLQSNPDAKCVRSDRVYIDFHSGAQVKALERTGNLEPHNIFIELLYGKTYVCCGCYMLKSQEFFEIYPDGNIPVYPVGQNFQMLLPFMYKYICYSLKEPLYKVNRRTDSHSAKPLTKEEEYKKYDNYENLIDDIIHIANIHDTKILSDISYWKFTRKKDLFTRHYDYPSLRNCLLQAYKNKIISFKVLIKELFEQSLMLRVTKKMKKKIKQTLKQYFRQT